MWTPTRILAIGDSLTAGYYQGGFRFHPYSQRLTSLFSSIGKAVHIDTQGISGEKVVRSMADRLENILRQTNGDVYDFVMILGGTNDLGWGQSAEIIFGYGLKLMYDQVLQTKSRLVVMTVIENRVNSPEHPDDQRRQHLNYFIRQYAENHPEKDRIFLVDLDREISFHHAPDRQQALLLWDDYIHFTPAGYDRMADIIFHVITARMS